MSDIIIKPNEILITPKEETSVPATFNDGGEHFISKSDLKNLASSVDVSQTQRGIMAKVTNLQKYEGGYSFQTPLGMVEAEGDCPEGLENGVIITIYYEI